MPRKNQTGVQGLIKENVRRYPRDTEGNRLIGPPELVMRWSLDVQWFAIESGGRVRKRHRERFPEGMKISAIKSRANDIRSKCLAGMFDPDAEKSYTRTLSDALDEYLAKTAADGLKSVRSKKSQAGMVKAIMGGTTPLATISAFAVEKFKRERLRRLIPRYDDLDDEERAEKVAAHASTVNRSIALIKHFARLAMQWKWISPLVATEIRTVKLLPEPEGRMRQLNNDEEAALFAGLPDGVKAIVQAALMTGMRRSELVNLRKVRST